MLKSELRADEYRAKALDAISLGDASPLAQVRDKHGAAAAAWLSLAALEDQRSAHARKVAARLAAGIGTAVAPSNTGDIGCTT